MSTYRGVNTHLALCLNSVLNVKVLVGAFNQEEAQIGAFSMIVQLHQLIVYSTSYHSYIVNINAQRIYINVKLSKLEHPASHSVRQSVVTGH